MNKSLKIISLTFLSLFLITCSHVFGYSERNEGMGANLALEHSMDGISSLQASSRAMYVDGFHTILGNDSLENVLLSYAQSREIQTLLLYNLHIVHTTYNLTDPVTNVVLADFISKAKTSYGITNMGATSENGDSFTNVIDAYNNSRAASNEKFDIYNLEFEFWIDTPVEPGGYYCENYLIPNGLPCSNAGGFQFFISTLQTMKSLANNNSHPITTEAYVGWPTASQADSIGDNLDLLRLHAYVADASTAFDYTENRVSNYAISHPDVDVSIIFSSEPEFMQTWLESNSLQSAEEVYTTDWLNASAGWPSNISLGGFTYFTYSDMTGVSLEDCPSTVELKDLIFSVDTTVNASSVIELDNVVVKSPHQLTLVAPDVHISIDCEISEGASIILIGEDGCNNE